MLYYCYNRRSAGYRHRFSAGLGQHASVPLLLDRRCNQSRDQSLRHRQESRLHVSRQRRDVKVDRVVRSLRMSARES